MKNRRRGHVRKSSKNNIQAFVDFRKAGYTNVQEETKVLMVAEERVSYGETK